MKLVCSLILLSQLSVLSQSRALYISPRTDGSSGAGTLVDPFNGSTPSRLWKAWQKTAFRSDGASDQVIVFLPGVYSSTNEMRLPEGVQRVRLIGDGATIVYAEKSLVGQRTMLGTAWGGNDDVTISGFTLDCSGVTFTNGNNAKVCGVFARGKHNVVRDITVRGLASRNEATVDQEAFGIILADDGGICSGNMIVGTSGQLNQVVTGISINGNDCTVRGNVIDLEDDDATNALTSFGYSIYGSRITLIGNVARRVDAGVSMDSSGSGGSNTWSDNVIVGNQIAGNEMVVRIQNNVQSYTNWVWIGNGLRAQGRAWLSIWTTDPWIAGSKLSGHSFIANLFTGDAREKANIILNNFEGPHAFSDNRFSVQPDVNLVTNRNDMIGADNIAKGRASMRVW